MLCQTGQVSIDGLMLELLELLWLGIVQDLVEMCSALRSHVTHRWEQYEAHRVKQQ